jgi:hypothetical protein
MRGNTSPAPPVGSAPRGGVLNPKRATPFNKAKKEASYETRLYNKADDFITGLSEYFLNNLQIFLAPMSYNRRFSVMNLLAKMRKG